MQLLFSLFPSPEIEFPLIAVILGLPLLGAFINGLFGKRLGPSGVHTMAVSAVGGSFFASVAAFAMLYQRMQQAGAGATADGQVPHVKFVWRVWRWFSLDSTVIDVVFSIDSLSAMMLLVVTGVGGLIHLYSIGYMAKDPGYHRFFAYMNLFVFSMLVLILGDNLPVLFVGWEGVGLCSYLLIGFWFDSDKNATAGKKAFIANRIGDFGLLVAMAMLLYLTGTLSFSGMEARASDLFMQLQIWPIGAGLPAFMGFLAEPVTVSGATLVGLALFLGCVGKSAQIPLYVWLPDAMAGPTPVSALIHAATMVTAGVYLVARMGFVFVLSPTAMMVVAGTGALTALFAATIGLVQHDLKKVLAYSTISQLGFMFMGVGVGAFASGMFHVVTHAFFKACLFLGAGSVIHAMHARVHDTDASQDMRNMGGLRRFMPITFWTYLAATAAIVGLPLTSGFFSKDDILFRVLVNRIKPSSILQSIEARKFLQNQGGGALGPEAKQKLIEALQTPDWFATSLYMIGIITAILTAFYMMRTVFLTFFGEFRGWRIVPGWSGEVARDELGHASVVADAGGTGAGLQGQLDGPVPRESPWTMWVPLVVLAFFSLFVGWLNAGPFHITAVTKWIQPVVRNATQLVATIQKGEALTNLEYRMLVPGILAFLVGTFGAYWFYHVKSGQPARQIAKQTGWLYRLVLDKWRIDELYEATVLQAFHSMAEAAAWFDKWVVDGIIARAVAWLIGFSGSVLRLLQAGRVQTYAAIMVLGTMALGVFFVRAHADVVVTKNDASDECVLSATPGLGFSYRWDRDGDGVWDNASGQADNAWTTDEQVQVRVGVGERVKVRLQVRNVFKMTRTKVLILQRPLPDKSVPTPIGAVGLSDKALRVSEGQVQ